MAPTGDTIISAECDGSSNRDKKRDTVCLIGAVTPIINSAAKLSIDPRKSPLNSIITWKIAPKPKIMSQVNAEPSKPDINPAR